MLSQVWAHRGFSERGSAKTYARLARLARGGAYARFAPLLAAASDDERRHAELCDAACVALGGVPLSEAPPESAVAWPGVSGDDAVLLETVIMCCLGETFNAALLQHELRRAADPVVRPVVRTLLADEVEHARIGWAILDAAAATGRVGHLAEPVARALGEAATRSHGAPMNDLDVHEIGAKEALFAATLAHVIVPGLRRSGLDVEAIDVVTAR